MCSYKLLRKLFDNSVGKEAKAMTREFTKEEMKIALNLSEKILKSHLHQEQCK